MRKKGFAVALKHIVVFEEGAFSAIGRELPSAMAEKTKYCLLPKGALRAFLRELRPFGQVIGPRASDQKGIAMGESRPFLGPLLQNSLRESPEFRCESVQRPHPSTLGSLGPSGSKF